MNFTRVTNKMMDDNVVRSMLTNRNTLNTTQQMISSGKKVTIPSDDPTAAVNILSTNTQLSKIENFVNTGKNALSEMEITDKAITSAVDVVHRVKELSVESSTATMGDDQLKSLRAEIDQLVQQLKDYGNTKFGDKYIFSGQKTDEKPFSDESNGIKYKGTPGTGDYKRLAEISDGVTVEMNLPGDELFGEYYEAPAGSGTYTSKGIIGTVMTISKELNNTPPNKDNIRTQLDSLDNNLNTLLEKQASLGGVMSRIEMTQNKLGDDKLIFTKFKSGLEDVDLAKAITDLNFQETALQASLQVSSKVIQPSLLNYL